MRTPLLIVALFMPAMVAGQEPPGLQLTDAPVATSNSPTHGRVKLLHPVGDGTRAH